MRFPSDGLYVQNLKKFKNKELWQVLIDDANDVEPFLEEMRRIKIEKIYKLIVPAGVEICEETKTLFGIKEMIEIV